MSLNKQQQQAAAPVIPSFGAQVGGRFKLIVHGGKRGRISTGWFDNLITDNGLKALCGDVGIAAYCVVGHSSRVPAATDTTLVDRISDAQNGSQEHGYDATDGTGWTRKTYSFSPGQATGNVREVGITRFIQASSNLFSRALVRDVSGQPATITVLADEYLTVIYELRRKWITPAPYTLSYTFAGQTHTTTVTHAEPLYRSELTGSSGGLVLLDYDPYFLTPTGSLISGGRKSGDIEMLASGATRIISAGLPPIQASSGVSALKPGKISGTAGTKSIPSHIIEFNPPLLKDNQHSLKVNMRFTVTRL